MSFSGLVLGSSKFLQLSRLPKKLFIASKVVVKSDFKIIIFLPLPKIPSLKRSVVGKKIRHIYDNFFTLGRIRLQPEESGYKVCSK